MIKFRNEFQGEFEAVLVSAYKDPTGMQKHMAELGLTFPAIRPEHDASRLLAQRYGVGTIPALVVLAPDGKEITRAGRDEVARDYKNALAKWKKK